MFSDWPKACGSKSPAPAFTLLLIFLDMALPYLNNILMGNSGLEFTPLIHLWQSKHAQKSTILYSWPSLLTNEALDKEQESSPVP